MLSAAARQASLPLPAVANNKYRHYNTRVQQGLLCATALRAAWALSIAREGDGEDDDGWTGVEIEGAREPAD